MRTVFLSSCASLSAFPRSPLCPGLGILDGVLGVGFQEDVCEDAESEGGVGAFDVEHRVNLRDAEVLCLGEDVFVSEALCNHPREDEDYEPVEKVTNGGDEYRAGELAELLADAATRSATAIVEVPFVS